MECSYIFIGTCEASRFDSNSNRTSRFEFDSKVTCRFENFELTAHAVCRHTTNYAHSLFNKNINLCAVCSWDSYLQLHLMCSCTAVARAHTQLPHDNQHWTCKRLPPDSIRDSIRAEISDSQVPIFLPIPSRKFAPSRRHQKCEFIRRWLPTATDL